MEILCNYGLYLQSQASPHDIRKIPQAEKQKVTAAGASGGTLAVLGSVYSCSSGGWGNERTQGSFCSDVSIAAAPRWVRVYEKAIRGRGEVRAQEWLCDSLKGGSASLPFALHSLCPVWGEIIEPSYKFWGLRSERTCIQIPGRSLKSKQSPWVPPHLAGLEQ